MVLSSLQKIAQQHRKRLHMLLEQKKSKMTHVIFKISENSIENK
jgi:hypothetical protein